MNAELLLSGSEVQCPRFPWHPCPPLQARTESEHNYECCVSREESGSAPDSWRPIVLDIGPWSIWILAGYDGEWAVGIVVIEVPTLAIDSHVRARLVGLAVEVDGALYRHAIARSRALARDIALRISRRADRPYVAAHHVVAACPPVVTVPANKLVASLHLQHEPFARHSACAHHLGDPPAYDKFIVATVVARALAGADDRTDVDKLRLLA